jgi:putative DNA primase/helicase
VRLGGRYDRLIPRSQEGRAGPASEEDSRARSGKSSDPSSAVTSSADDAALADRFAKRRGDDLRYVAAWSKWLHYNGKVWKVEATHLARDLAKQLCQVAAREREGNRRIASSKTIAGVQTLAAAHRKIAATVDQWDADPWLLNTPAGVVDLRTGETRAHRPNDHLTKITAVGAGGQCPRWLAFLRRIFNGNAELVQYMQRVLGYCLTGCTQEHAMFFGYGTGSNGKSVLIDTVAGILGDYHTTAPIETFAASAGDRHPTEVARLCGARLVTAVETEEGRRWAETRIKTLTGGDKIAARLMRQDFFEFKPQFKLFIAGNHKPTLRTVDEAIRRRFNMLPFAVTIPVDERDPKLPERLRAEWPGILQWMIDGCIAWQEQGLAPPKAVTDATAAYLEAQDAMAAWLDECCTCEPNASDTPSRLFSSWKAYAERTGNDAGSTRTFGPQLEARGFRYHRTGIQRSYKGLRVNEEPCEPHLADR